MNAASTRRVVIPSIAYEVELVENDASLIERRASGGRRGSYTSPKAGLTWARFTTPLAARRSAIVAVVTRPARRTTSAARSGRVYTRYSSAPRTARRE
eukprot:13689116-Heterocapsa_arctica.AAC.1